ncbi:MAG: BamA/TamA family outer membrane protein [Clostridia bacterium]|nr:BamA/TamA family outer membrane protein [Clostridia bacterium]
MKDVRFSRFCGILAVMVAAVLLASSAAWAAEPKSLGKVTAIEVQGNQRIDSDIIIRAMAIKVGDELTEQAINTSFGAIDALGWFADLGANTAPYLGGVKLIVIVQEFPVISKVSISGNKLIGSDVLTAALGSKPNAQLNMNTLRVDLQALGKIYQDKGYWVSIEPSVQEQGVLSLNVFEWTVADVRVSGNEKTKAYVIQRSIQTKSGDYVDVNKINDDRRRVYMLGAFEDVEAKVEPVPGKYEYAINYVVKERKTGTANMGITYSSATGLTGYLQLGDENFLGNAQTVNLRAEFGGGQTNYEIGFHEPWVGKSGKTSAGFNLFAKSVEKKYTPAEDVDDGNPDTPAPIQYKQRKTGGDVTIGRSLSLNTTASLKLRIENAVNTAVNPEDQLLTPAGGNTRSLTLSAQNDTRDDLWNPAAGHRVTGSVEYAGGLLGGDASFSKVEAEGSIYRQVREGHILAGRVSGGFGLAALPEDQQFKLGGAETVRGYNYGDFQGDRMALANAEYRFSIVKGFQGVVFVDAGQAWKIGEPFQLSNTKMGYGVGVRVMVPVLGMIRVDYGIGKNGGQAYFSFGQTF